MKIWAFMYHQGPAPKFGHVATEDSGDEGQGLAVATAWCLANRCRPPAAVRPFILADETILRGTVPVAPDVEVTSAVGATTSVGESLKAALGFGKK